ncbi:glyoxalase [Ekhidna sp. MALMAid0563]|uniref:glyoxalase n=1 Tax=Ekhidna sp. MALMAid0563 TaxID=3143937 RepID=UPI0032DE5DC0
MRNYINYNAHQQTMKPAVNSIRTFIGAKDYQLSRDFYSAWGFEETITSPKLSYFAIDNFGFYLQDHFVKDWVENSMVFLEVESLSEYWEVLKAKNLDQKFKGVKLVEPTTFDWGNEGFVYDPSGVLWHIGEFN